MLLAWSDVSLWGSYTDARGEPADWYDLEGQGARNKVTWREGR